MSIRPLGSKLKKLAESELHEVPDRIKEDLEHILEWHKKEPHLNIRTDEQWLLGFLRGCKFSLQRTKEKLDFFYTLKTLLPEYYANRDPFSPEIQEVLKVGAILPLPITNDPAGGRILMIRYENCNPDKISISNLMKTFLMFMDVLIVEDDNSTVAGIYLWADYAGFSFNYVTQYTLSFVKKFVVCIQSAYPLRIKGIYCINLPSFIETILNIGKNFLNDKLKSRVGLYSERNFDKFQEEVPKFVLPKEFGGNGSSLEEIAAHWKEKIESYSTWFLEDTKYCSNEKLRLDKAKTSADVFDIEGSFRKLTID